MNANVHYDVFLESVHTHQFRVVCTFESHGEVKFSLPSWTPGSYLIREFAQHIIGIKAYQDEKETPLRKIDKDTWTLKVKKRSPIKVEYLFYAFDPSIRACFLDDSYAFFSGSSLFIRVHSFEQLPHTLFVHRPNHEAYAGSIVSTSMQSTRLDGHGFGLYSALDYDDAVDHPFLICEQTKVSFKLNGIEHSIYVTPKVDFDAATLAEDCKKICAEHKELFGVLPFPHYAFLIRAEPEGYGGIEHRASSALLCRIDDLPSVGSRDSKNYRNLLGLISHEYFHAWNIKQLKPRSFIPYNYNAENYTDLLWFFEGFTSYYDDLALCRSKVISPLQYLELLSESISRVYASNGRLKQSLCEASFDAWIKFYRPHENSPNTHVSYYQKGSLAALFLDLKMRSLSNGTSSLDELMKYLWMHYGSTGRGIVEEDIVNALNGMCDQDHGAFLKELVHTTKDIAFEPLLESVGINTRWVNDDNSEGLKPYLGCIFEPNSSLCQVKTVHDNSPAQIGGVYAGDQIVAINGKKVTSANIKTLINTLSIGSYAQIHLFRKEKLRDCQVLISDSPKTKCLLTWAKNTSDAQKKALRSWLKLGIDEYIK